ncbi:MAG: MaoC family dehydratase N-terminal domain-containing protein, partial [bacterium]
MREGVGLSTEERVTGDDVNGPMIRHWCDAMGDQNPVYTDPDFAAKSVHGGIVAPPSMLDTWAMPGLSAKQMMSASAEGAAGMIPVMQK